MSETEVRAKLEPEAQDVNPFASAVAASQAVSMKRIADAAATNNPKVVEFLEKLAERAAYINRALTRKR